MKITRENAFFARTTIGGILVAATVIVGCDQATAPDLTPPAVTSTSPANSSVGVLINSVITISFSEAMNPSTMNASSVTLKASASNAPVSAVVAYDAATHTAALTPSVPLDYDTGYTLSVTTAASDLAGNAMTANYTANFRSIQRVFGKPYFQGTNSITDASQPQIHVHLRFTQSGQTLGRPADCEMLPDANCDLLPRNTSGASAIGTLDDQGIAATITQITGTFTDPNISFTITLANGRTFSFSGTVTNSFTMTGTLSGPTLPAIQIVLSRGLEP